MNAGEDARGARAKCNGGGKGDTVGAGRGTMGALRDATGAGGDDIGAEQDAMGTGGVERGREGDARGGIGCDRDCTVCDGGGARGGGTGYDVGRAGGDGHGRG